MGQNIKHLAALGGALLLLGAGCLVLPGRKTAEAPPPAAPSAPAPPVIKPGALLLNKVEALNPGIVKLEWSAPSDLAPGALFRLLHSSSPDPELETGAFWYQVTRDTRETAWGQIPAGKRHFRVCEFKEGKCQRYSNTVEAEVP
ncbi:MAG: hypothetical protein HYV42_04090 [Candidatus Magasanikbacteria bacterium]|nr:hypothetical protein [Candidatus Magasanikbacteria bacterium]